MKYIFLTLVILTLFPIVTAETELAECCGLFKELKCTSEIPIESWERSMLTQEQIQEQMKKDCCMKMKEYCQVANIDSYRNVTSNTPQLQDFIEKMNASLTKHKIYKDKADYENCQVKTYFNINIPSKKYTNITYQIDRFEIIQTENSFSNEFPLDANKYQALIDSFENDERIQIFVENLNFESEEHVVTPNTPGGRKGIPIENQYINMMELDVKHYHIGALVADGKVAQINTRISPCTVETPLIPELEVAMKSDKVKEWIKTYNISEGWKKCRIYTRWNNFDFTWGTFSPRYRGGTGEIEFRSGSDVLKLNVEKRKDGTYIVSEQTGWEEFETVLPLIFISPIFLICIIVCVVIGVFLFIKRKKAQKV